LTRVITKSDIINYAGELNGRFKEVKEIAKEKRILSDLDSKLGKTSPEGVVYYLVKGYYNRDIISPTRQVCSITFENWLLLIIIINLII
jgi:hypothetical protein